jgi:adenosylmethionine---8-amino-7-oxononanoate aminotransferase
MQSNFLKPGNSELADKDRQYVWHPFSPFPDEGTLVVEKGEGVWLYTSDGRKILDGVSSWWVNLFGHGNPEIAQAIARQAMKLEHVIFAGFTHEPAVRLAESVLKIAGDNFSKVYFTDNGSTAIEVALKMALHYWYATGEKRTRIVAIEGAYHGDTFGAMSVGARSLFTAPFTEHLFETAFIPFPEGDDSATLEAYENLCREGNVAAFIYEPLVQGTAGMRVYPAETLEKLLQISERYKVINIADEVFTGFGRTGKFFASDYCNTKPDLMCLSKGITGGFLPLGVTLCSHRLTDVFWNAAFEKLFFHGHSYTGNPLACAAANASLRLLNDPAIFQQIERIGASHKEFAEKLSNYSCIKRVDHLGTILAIEFESSDQSGYTSNFRNFLYQYFLSQNILLRPLGNVIYLVPPYVISKEELNLIYGAVESLCKKI